MALVALDMTAMDKKDEDGKIICNVPKLVDVTVRAGMDVVSHRKNVICI